jgi:hypothetical protein
VGAQSHHRRLAQRQVAIIASLAVRNADNRPLAVDAADLQADDCLPSGSGKNKVSLTEPDRPAA